MPSRPLGARPDGPHAAPHRWPHRARDRSRLRCARADHRPAHRPRQEDDRPGGRAFEVPSGPDRASRLGSVLQVIYLVYNEGYSATSGEDWLRPELCAEALRLGRVLAALAPEEPEVWGLVALMEFQSSRLRARIGPSGAPVLLLDQDRRTWDRLHITRGESALARAQAPGAAPRSVHVAGGNRRLPRTRPSPRGNRLDSARRVVRRARTCGPVPDRRAEPGRRGLHGLGPGRRPAAGRSVRRDGHARALPPAVERPRRSAPSTRAPCRGRRWSSTGPRRWPPTRKNAPCPRSEPAPAARRGDGSAGHQGRHPDRSTAVCLSTSGALAPTRAAAAAEPAAAIP